ncbi:hypothetical protein BAUCODRAFT_575245 [Baudoinia panamericana UAMH 10762]|uniref:Thioredoxin domain-containing protein n=1 Tax=Baudoinia panamericana (strain UAMH 10762) TaxID=717646 RepID=M2NDP9_BAUPA|nr:uncharacterized protein BAUCODRAFT_575245 [Baudoinia panamericana UAMH 10762]EMC97349.1 hypothetical protein BAUCODRAFT_575245 [Baudoinia panamericana UAMH 10762]
MATLDTSVASVVDRHHTDINDEDEDALFAELEDESQDHAFSGLRERRLEQLKAELSRAKVLKESQHGTYAEIKDEKLLMDITTSTAVCIVHFQKPDFARCRIMDEKLGVLAEQHYEARFVSINVENAPFLVVKLGIQVLPCVIAFRDGVSADRIVGFEGIGYKPDSFTARELEARLLGSGVLTRAKVGNGVHGGARKKQTQYEEAEDDDDDFD